MGLFSGWSWRSLVRISIKATEPQAAFLGMHCKFPAFVAGFGTGKSEVMCNSALLDSLEGGASSMIAMYEPTYDLEIGRAHV